MAAGKKPRQEIGPVIEAICFHKDMLLIVK